MASVSNACNFCAHHIEFEFKENLMVINDVHFPLRIGFSFTFSVCLFNAHPFAIVIMIIGNFNDDDECFQLDNLWILHRPSHHMACHFVKYQFTFSRSLSFSLQRWYSHWLPPSNGWLFTIFDFYDKRVFQYIKWFWNRLSFFIH